MESFPEASGRLLREFKLQLSHRPLLVSAERLLHITAINMFSVDNTVPKGGLQAVALFMINNENIVIVTVITTCAKAYFVNVLWKFGTARIRQDSGCPGIFVC